MSTDFGDDSDPSESSSEPVKSKQSLNVKDTCSLSVMKYKVAPSKVNLRAVLEGCQFIHSSHLGVNAITYKVLQWWPMRHDGMIILMLTDSIASDLVCMKSYFDVLNPPFILGKTPLQMTELR